MLNLNLGKISLFCKQFNIYNQSSALTKKTIPEIYKRVTSNFKSMEEREFKVKKYFL